MSEDAAKPRRGPSPPDRIVRLPKDRRGYYVPWFVAWIDGVPDFRVIAEGRIAQAHTMKRCWICGERLGVRFAFVIGPMCAVNRVSSEPPSHVDCAEYAAQVCPFLTLPKAERNERVPLPENARAPAGIPLRRNPGVALVWVTRSYQPIAARDGGVLFRVGPALSVRWYAEGRPATHAEVLASIESGLPLLREAAEAQGGGAVEVLEQMHSAAMQLVPDDGRR